MLKRCFLFSVTIAIIFFNCKTNGKKPDQASIAEVRQFRNVNWGMTKEEVLKNETAVLDKIQESDDVLKYSGVELFGRQFSLSYAFDSLKLKGAFYQTTFFDNESPTEKFKEVKEALTEKYGRPIKDTIYWSGTYLNLPQNERNLEDAVDVRDAILQASWIDTSSGTLKRLIGLRCEKSGVFVQLNVSNIDPLFFIKIQNRIKDENKKNL
jgi:hypothetical protein